MSEYEYLQQSYGNITSNECFTTTDVKGDIPCVKMDLYPFNHNIYPLCVFNECLYYICSGRAFICSNSIHCPDRNSRLVNLELNFEKHHFFHVVWKHYVFLFISKDEGEDHVYSLHVVSLLETKQQNVHSLKSDANIAEFFVSPVLDYLLFIDKKTLHICGLFPFSVLLKEKTTDLNVLSANRTTIHDRVLASRPMLILLDTEGDKFDENPHLVIFDANEPSRAWRHYTLSLANGTSRSCPVMSQSSMFLPIGVSNTSDETPEGIKKWTIQNITHVPLNIVNTGCVSVSNNRQYICLGVSRVTDTYHIFSFQMGSLKAKRDVRFGNNTYLPMTFKKLHCQLPFQTDREFTLVPSITDPENIYLLEWHRSPKQFKRYVKSMYKLVSEDLPPNSSPPDNHFVSFATYSHAILNNADF